MSIQKVNEAQSTEREKNKAINQLIKQGDQQSSDIATNTASIAAINATLGGISSLDLAFTELALQVADNTNVALFLGDGGNRVFDSFDALTYINTGGATNLDTSTAGVLKPSQTGGLISGATGTNIGDMTSNGGLATAFDGTTTQASAASAVKLSSTSAYVGKHYSPAQKISSAEIFSTSDVGFLSSTGNLTLNLRGKNGSAPSSSSDGTLLGTTGSFTDPNTTSNNTITSSDQTTTWDYIWIEMVPSSSQAMGIAEVQFSSPVVTNNMIVTSTGLTAAAVPSTMKALLRVKEVDAAVAGTDYTLEVSRDGGTTWTTATLTELFTSPSPDASIRVVQTNSVDVSAQPSGTSPMWRFKTLNNKNIQLYDAALYWAA